MEPAGAGLAPGQDLARLGASPIARLPEAVLVRAGWWVALAVLCVVLVAPLLLVDVPPLVDYPNHLARAFVLASLPHDPVIATFYAAHWAIIPNLALDLIMPPLLSVMPVHDAGRLVIAVAVLLPVLGVVAYATALGQRWWCLAVGLIAYNGTLLAGFLNFNVAAGLALLLAAAWTRWRERHPVATTALAAAGAIGLFACHLMGLLFLGVLLGAAELVRVLPHLGDPAALGRQLVARGTALAVIVAAPLALYAASALQQLGGDAVFVGMGDKLANVLVVFTGYWLALDIVTAVAVVGVPGLCLLARRGRMPGPAGVAGAVLLVAYVASPYAWKGTFQLDTRFAIMLGLMAFAGFVPERWPTWFSRTVAGIVVVLFLARMAVLTTAFGEHRADLSALRLALEPVRPGQALYVVSIRPTDPDAYWARMPWSRRLSNGVQTDSHLGALALIEHRAWWPFEFDNASQQPMRTLPRYAAMAVRVAELPDQFALAKADLCGFDAVLVTNADAAPAIRDGRLALQVDAGFAASYKVADCRAAAGP